MDFNKVVGTRRSIRWFKSWEPVEREKIQRILEAVRLTTCPGNLQPWRVRSPSNW
jgi:nitroreductase